VILTGFEPYGGRGINPAAEVVRRLDGEIVAGTPVVGRLLPVSYRRLGPNIEDLLREHDPAAVVGLGLWPGEPAIRLERLAVNVADFEIADNEGALLTDVAVQGNADAALFATWPLRRAETALLDAGIPARASSTAGTFLCNATLYRFLRGLEAAGGRVPCGFVHLPYLPAQVAALVRDLRRERRLELGQRADLASMDLETMVRAVRIVLETCLTGPSQ
jgi:pyroglutamyl-peptidase